MNRTELVNAMAEKAHTSKRDAEIFLRTFIDIVEHEIAEGHEVKLVGFGTFEPREIVAHEGKHPRTGEKITMPQKHRYSEQARTLRICLIIK